jgi:serine/threonine-protein kinase
VILQYWSLVIQIEAMAKVFTITEGLENMGALRTGGQGSVYKARRKDGTITAVKLLPTPILSESLEDKNYRDFHNEVEKLKKVNESPNPHVVTILNSGITETGSFPFIEMEFIEGPDLEELLKPPHAPLFSVFETVKVARHISNAIAHCHTVGVKHGDIKTNNVKLNSKTGNYVLLDFGLAVMSDEQRRTSLRHAGAIEFMAPEQNEGKMLFQTDVYSFGIIIYELLAGRVPFPLGNKSETARNHVMVAHMEKDPPDAMQLRAEKLPADWSQERKEREMQVPAWLLEMIDICLQKDPEKRFANGMELLDFIHSHNNETPIVEYPVEEVAVKEDMPVVTTKEVVDETPVFVRNEYAEEVRPARKTTRISPLLIVLPLLLLLGFGAYYVLGKKSNANEFSGNTSVLTTDSTSGMATNNAYTQDSPVKKPSRPKKDTAQQAILDSIIINVPDSVANEKPATNDSTTSSAHNADDNKQAETKSNKSGKYKVRSQAYFHNEPDESTRRNAFMTQWDASFTPLDETDDFVYVIFTNEQGQTSKGWLRKKDLIKLK